MVHTRDRPIHGRPVMSYYRVIPRDLFNESKLLKCLGRLALLIHDGMVPHDLTVSHNGPDAFVAYQRTQDGGLWCPAITFRLKEQELNLYSAYNSKAPYPLLCETEEDTVFVFEDDGELTTEFKELIGG